MTCLQETFLEWSVWYRCVYACICTYEYSPDAGAQAYWDPFNATNSVELPCEPGAVHWTTYPNPIEPSQPVNKITSRLFVDAGYYCTKGIKYPCPPGNVWSLNLSTDKDNVNDLHAIPKERSAGVTGCIPLLVAGRLLVVHFHLI